MFKCANKMKLTKKQLSEFRKTLHLNGENAAKAAWVYRRNHRLRQANCSVRSLCDLIKKSEETVSTCVWSQFGRLFILVGVFFLKCRFIARNARSLHTLKSKVFRLLRFVLRILLYWFCTSTYCSLELNNILWTSQIFSLSDMIHKTDGRSGYYGRMRFHFKWNR